MAGREMNQNGGKSQDGKAGAVRAEDQSPGISQRWAAKATLYQFPRLKDNDQAKAEESMRKWAQIKLSVPGSGKQQGPM